VALGRKTPYITPSLHMSYRRPPLAAEYTYVVYDSIRTTVKTTKFRQVPSRAINFFLLLLG
jgi:hypothetical protein